MTAKGVESYKNHDFIAVEMFFGLIMKLKATPYKTWFWEWSKEEGYTVQYVKY